MLVLNDCAPYSHVADKCTQCMKKQFTNVYKKGKNKVLSKRNQEEKINTNIYHTKTNKKKNTCTSKSIALRTLVRTHLRVPWQNRMHSRQARRYGMWDTCNLSAAAFQAYIFQLHFITYIYLSVISTFSTLIVG